MMEPNIQKALSRWADEYNRIWELRYQDFENEHIQLVSRRPAIENVPHGERIVLSIEQAALMVGLSRATFLKLVYAGEIPSKQIGRRRLIPTAGLKAWLNQSYTS